jgi:hypothetical protein
MPAKAHHPSAPEFKCSRHRRNGTVNLFVCIDVHRPWRKVKVTERRAAEDYAQCMRELTDVHYPDAGARIKWMFTTDKARAKMGRAYPVMSKES